ncbi:hypothetical protein, partial [Photobacterium sp. OFAV2-7]|uniref:hypothetical protein n=1 Tax=Photobacterium sp. OFAV2-7 TaxID=2917748 RepID=UPI001EF7398A
TQEQHQVAVLFYLGKSARKFGLVVTVNLLLLRQWNSMRFLLLFAVLFSSLSLSNSPKCDNPNSWAPRMAYIYLAENKFFTDDEVEHDKIIVRLIASEKIANDIYRQVHHVIFKLKSGEDVEVITSNEASSEECSYSGVKVFVISSTFSDPSA